MKLTSRYVLTILGALAFVLTVTVGLNLLIAQRALDQMQESLPVAIDKSLGDLSRDDAVSRIKLITEAIANPFYLYLLRDVADITGPVASQPDVLELVILDPDRRVVMAGADFLTRFGEQITDEYVETAFREGRITIFEDIDRVVIATPIVVDGQIIGGVRLALSKQVASAARATALASLDRSRELATRSYVRASVILFVVLGITAFILSVFFARGLVRPIRALRLQARQIGAGDFKISPAVTRSDELGDLAQELVDLGHDLDTKTVSKSYLDSVLRAMVEPLIIFDEQAKIYDVNRAASQLFGKTKADLVGQRVADFLVGVDPSSIVSDSRETDSLNEEGELVLGDGRRLPVLISTASVGDDVIGRPLWITVLKDITDRKKIERELEQSRDEAESANRMKSDFLATMSHEIRTPLNGILGMTHVMLDEPQLGGTIEKLTVVRESAFSLLTVLNDVLDLSKVEAGRLDLEITPFRLTSFVKNVASFWEDMVHEKGLKFAVRMDISDDLLVQGDPARIRQILGNLISNARKFTAAGEIGLEVRMTHRQNRRVRLEFAVSDTGIGIPQDVQSDIFDRFVQADLSTTRKYGGTGLGLAICQNLVELMGGEISVSSVPDEGSRFQFSIDLPEALSEDIAQFQKQALADHAGIRALSILVVEDVAVNQDVLRFMLRRDNHKIHCVSDGLEAVQAVQDFDFDLVLMDIQMPVMDGLTATARIRELDGDKSTVPIIALTAHAMRGDREKYLAAGMTDYVSKPIDPDNLQITIATVMGWAPATPSGSDATLSDGDSPSPDPSGEGALKDLAGEL